MGIPDNWRAGIIDVGPGIDVILTSLLIQCWINLKPGSEINGEPASDIKAMIFLSNLSANNCIIELSL